MVDDNWPVVCGFEIGSHMSVIIISTVVRHWFCCCPGVPSEGQQTKYHS